MNGGTLLHDDTDSGSHGFAGKIDDLRVYNRALSVADIEALARNDLDRDDMPDDWERRFFASTHVLPGADEDGDGLSNLSEYGADTDPTNAASVLRITSVEASGDGTMRVHWQGGVNGRQRVESAAATSPPVTGWASLVTLEPPTPATTNVALPAASAGAASGRYARGVSTGQDRNRDAGGVGAAFRIAADDRVRSGLQRPEDRLVGSA